MAENVELVFQFRTQGEQDLEKILASLRGLPGGIQPASVSLDSLAKSSTAANAGVAGLSRGLTGILPVAGLAAAAIGSVATGAYSLVTSMASAALESRNLAARIGLTVGEYERLNGMARIAGVNLGMMETASRSLATALADQGGTGVRTAEALRSLGVSTTTLTGNQREMGSVLFEVLERLSRIQDSAQRVAAAQKALGTESAAALLPVIKNYDELNAAIERLGIGLNEHVNDNLSDAGRKINELNLAWDKFKEKLAEKIAPIVIPVITALTPNNGQPPPVGWAASQGLLNPDDLSISSDPSGAIFRDLLRGFGDIYARDANAAIDSDVQRGRDLSGRFRAEMAASETGRKQRLKEVEGKIRELESVLSGDLIGSVFDTKKKELDALRAEAKRIEASLKKPSAPVDSSVSLRFPQAFDFLDSRNFLAGVQEASRAYEQEQTDAAELARNRAALDLFSTRARGRQGAGLNRIPIEQLTREQEIRERINEMTVSAYIRLTELGDDEIQNAIQVRDIRLATAKDAAEYRQAELDFQVRVAEIEKQREQRYENQARAAYRNLRQGGAGGFGAFLGASGDQLLEQLFVNVSGRGFRHLGSTLGRIGGQSGLPDWLLKDTIFDKRNGQDLSAVTADNSKATVENTRALLGFTQVLSGGAPVSSVGATIPTLLNTITGGGGLFSGQGDSPLVFHGMPIVGRAQTGAAGSPLVSGPSTFARSFGYGAAALGAGAGIWAGVREGGARGALTATGSVAGAGAGLVSSGLLGASLAAGPLAPILAGVGIGLGLIKSLLGDPRAEFEASQNRVLSERVYRGPEFIERSFDVATGANDFSSNYRRAVRVFNNYTINVSAVDGESIKRLAEDNSAVFADVVGRETRAGNPNMMLGINQTIHGPGAI